MFVWKVERLSDTLKGWECNNYWDKILLALRLPWEASVLTTKYIFEASFTIRGQTLISSPNKTLLCNWKVSSVHRKFATHSAWAGCNTCQWVLQQCSGGFRISHRGFQGPMVDVLTYYFTNFFTQDWMKKKEISRLRGFFLAPPWIRQCSAKFPANVSKTLIKRSIPLHKCCLVKYKRHTD